MDLTKATWPAALLSPRVAPVEPRRGLPSIRVRLGQWWSPERFPWDVSLVLATWGGVREGRHALPAVATDGLILEVPSLLLAPRPWARPGEDYTADLRKWRGAALHRRTLTSASEKASWEPLIQLPAEVATLWANSSDATRRVSESVAGTTESSQAHERRLRRIGREVPWYFLLSEELPIHLAAVVELDGDVAMSDILASGWQWLRMTDRADADSVRNRRREIETAARAGRAFGAMRLNILPDEHDLERGLFEALSRDAVETGVSHAEISAYIAGKTQSNHPATGAAGPYDRHRAWRRGLDQLGVQPTLVPLPRGNRVAALKRHDNVPGSWAARWLCEDSVCDLLRLAFGAQVDRLRWLSSKAPPEGPAAALPEGPPGGLDRFSRPGWTHHLVPEPDDSDHCARIEWKWSPPAAADGSP